MGTGSTWSLLKSLVMNSGSESCLRPVVLELWAEVSCLKGKTDTLQYSHTFLRPQTDMTFQGKKKKKAEDVDCFPCQETELLCSSQESYNDPAWVWLICNWIGTNLRKVFKKYLEVMVSLLNCFEHLTVPIGVLWSIKNVVTCELLEVGDEGWWWYVERNKNFLFWSGMVAGFDAY